MNDPNSKAEREAFAARAALTPPEDPAALTIGAPPKRAAGLGAVVSALGSVVREMGLLRGVRALTAVNQREGFDCQSCAWPNPEGERHDAEFCENGAKAVAAEGTRRRADRDFFARYSIGELAGRGDDWLNAQGRLTEPMLLRRGGDPAAHYEPIGWDEAFALVAAELAELRRLATPDRAVFYTSGRTSNEAAFLWQILARSFGTNNLPDCSNMCHESSGVALGETLGTGKGTVHLADFEVADAIFVIGQNPGTNHPRMLSALGAAARRGATIVAVNPLAEVGTERFVDPQDIGEMVTGGTTLATLHLPVRVGGDGALFKAIAKQMLEEERELPGSVVDRDFVAAHTSGVDAYEASVAAHSWEELEAASGVGRDLVRRAARVAIESRRTIACWAMGLTQHEHAVATIQEVVNFLLLRGMVGKPGAGVCPVRGHSNVQGDRTMGITTALKPAFAAALERELAVAVPARPGLDTVNAIRAMHAGEVGVFLSMGGNFLSATPDTAYTSAAVSRCDLTVQVSTKLNRGHLVTGRRSLILPCLGRSERDARGTRAGSAEREQFVTVEDSMSVVSPSRGNVPPASEHLLSEVAIVARLARATLGSGSPLDWEGFENDYDSIRDAIARVVPGFEDFNARVQRGPFHLPNAARERRFETPGGRAHFTVHPLASPRRAPGRYTMMTIRTHDQFNTTIYGRDDRYRGIHGGRRVVLMNPEDAAAAGLASGALADLTSYFAGETRHAPRFTVVPYDIPRGCAATYFPEGNVLVPIGAVAAKSNTPTSKSVEVSITPARPL